jgi:CRISPR/Cas system-associated exonuclease Cas4 (RecB family)
MSISQSFIKDSMGNDVCPKYIKYRFVDRIELPPTDAMLKGKYFEWHLLGATRDGTEPKFEELSRGRKAADGSMDKRPKEQLEMDELISYAREVLKTVGLDTSQGEKQLRITTDGMDGHIDWVTKDISDATRKAIYDVKYTDTKFDDRWNGWADFESKWDAKLQAAHYTILYFAKYGVYLPFYFLVFGKAKWCRIIKVHLTQIGVDQHATKLADAEIRLDKWEEQGFPATPEFNKCMVCGYNGICPHRAIKPTIEIFEI